MSDIRERRLAETTNILASLYLPTCGDINKQVDLRIVGSAVGLDPLALESRTQDMFAQGLLVLEAANTATLKRPGMEAMERALETLWAQKGADVIEAKGFGPHFEVMAQLRWERYCVLQALYQVAGGAAANWVWLDPVMRASGLVERRFEFAADWHVEFLNLKFPATQQMMLTPAGRDYHEEFMSDLGGGATELMWTLEEFRVRDEERRQRVIEMEWTPMTSAIPALEARDFQDEDGVWMGVALLRDRFGIPKSHLKRWRSIGCPALGGRQLRAKEIPAFGWTYCRADVHEIATRRDEVESAEEKLDRLSAIVRERRSLLED